MSSSGLGTDEVAFNAEALIDEARNKLRDAMAKLGDVPAAEIEDETLNAARLLVTRASEMLQSATQSRIDDKATKRLSR